MSDDEVPQKAIDIVKKFNEENPAVIEIAKLLGKDLKDEAQLVDAIRKAPEVTLVAKPCDSVVFPLLKRISDNNETYFREIFKDFYSSYIIGGAVALKHEDAIYKIKEELETEENLLLYIPNFIFIYEGLYSEIINFLAWPLVYSKEWPPNREKPVRDFEDFRERIPLNNKREVLKKHFEHIDKANSLYIAEKWRLIRNSIAHSKFNYSKTYIDLQEYGKIISLDVFENEVNQFLSLTVDLAHSIVNFKTSFKNMDDINEHN